MKTVMGTVQKGQGRKLWKLFVPTLLVALLALTLTLATPAGAEPIMQEPGTLSPAIELSDNTAGATSNYTFYFMLSTDWAPGRDLWIHFPYGVQLHMLSPFSQYIDINENTGIPKNLPNTGYGVYVSGGTMDTSLWRIVRTASAFTLPAGTTVILRFQGVVNPATAGDYVVTLDNGLDSGSFTIHIGSSSAPYIDFSVVGNGHIEGYNPYSYTNVVEGSCISGTVAEVFPRADAGWYFDHWTGDLSGNYYMFKHLFVVRNTVVGAVFRNTVPVAVSWKTGGSVSPGSGDFAFGSSVTFTATSNPGYHFVQWNVNGHFDEWNTSDTITMDIAFAMSDKTVEAVFEPNVVTFDINKAGAGSGTIAQSQPGTTFTGQTSLTLTATANRGSRFDRWDYELSPNHSTEKQLTFGIDTTGAGYPSTQATVRDGSYAIAGYFIVPSTYYVDAGISGIGSVSVSPAKYNLPGTSVTLTAIPLAGKTTFSHWETSDITLSDADAHNASLTFIMPAWDMKIRAFFTGNNFNLTASANPAEGGSVNPASGTFAYGSSVNVTATPNPGWYLSGWTGVQSDLIQGNIATVYIWGDTTAAANFAVSPYTLTYDGNCGTGTAPAQVGLTGGANFNAATNTFTAPAGTQFVGWNTASQGTGTSYAAGASVTMPEQDLTLYANWQPNLFFSEYLEGGFGSSDHAFEIYNPSGATVDLSAGGYNIQMYQDGGSSPMLAINLTGTLQAGRVYVVAQEGANSSITNKANLTDGQSGWFDGNDPIVLRRGTTILDVFGQIPSRVANGWENQSKTIRTWFTDLRRNPGVTQGDSDPNDTFDPAVEWQQFNATDYNGLDNHLISPTIAFDSASSSGSESATTVNLPVSLSVSSSSTVTVNYAATGGTATGGGVDYTLDSGTLTFSPGATRQNILLTVVNDNLHEENETVIINLSNPTNATLGTNSAFTHTIIDDDALGTTTVRDGTSPTNKYVKAADINKVVSAFTLGTDTGTNNTVTGLIITGTNTANVAGGGVRLWRDNGIPTEWDAADTFIANVSFSGSTATFSSLNIPVVNTPVQYLVSYDIAASATNGATLTAYVSGVTATNSVTNNDDADATLTVDTVAPTINIGPPSATTTEAGPVTFTITYTDDHFYASTLAAGDITLNKTGTASGSVSVDTGTGTSRTVTISSTTGGGTLGISIGARTASDMAGNPAPIAGPSTIFSVVNEPMIPNVNSSLDDGAYSVGQVIPIQVVFVDNVTVTGTPQLILSTGSPATTAASYASGSGTNVLTFNYTVAAGNASSDLDYAATNSLALNGGTIKDAAGNNASLTLPAPGAAGSLSANKAIVIETSFTIIVSPGPHGGITPATGSVNDGAIPAYTVSPDSGYHIVDVTVDGSSVKTSLVGNVYTFPAVHANHTIAATFAINTYTLTYAAGAHGFLSGNATQTVAYGGNGTVVTAVPAANYHFLNWTGTDTSTANPRTDLNVTANITVQANFAINTYTLAYTAGANGSLTGNATQTVAYGGNGSAVTAVPAANYHFVNWTPGGSTTNPRADLAVTANITVQANFAINTYTLTYNAGTNGSLTGNATQTVDYGGNGTAVTAVPAANYHFVNWTPGSSTSNPRTDLNMTANVTVQANFAIDTFILTYTTGAHGSLIGNATQTVDYGGSGTAVTAVPSANYHFVDWTPGGSAANPRTDLNVTSNVTVQANFAINTFTLTYSTGANGSISGNSSQTVASGGSGTPVSAVPNATYHFVNWSDSSIANPRTDLNVNANITVQANFAINTYTLTYNAGANGSISGNSSQTVAYGGNGTPVSAVPNPTYHFVNWSDSSTANPRTDTGVTANISVTANFAINTYTLTYSTGANGSISGNSSQTTASGGSGTPVSAVPNPTYHFVNWSDSSTANPRTDLNVTANISVTANFAINTYTLTYNAGANGSISGNSSQTVASGGSGSPVSAVPNATYHFVNWSDASAANPRTDSGVTANVSVTANFAINTYTLTYNAGANGSISGNSSQTAASGGSGTPVSAVPNPTYHFVNWSDASTANPRTDLNVTANINVQANFAINTFTLTYNAGANGSISGNATQIVAYGGSGSAVTALPAANYHFVNWTPGGSTANPRTDANVTADITVQANFAINSFTLTYNHDANGSISGNATQIVAYGGSGSAVTAVPNTGYHFVNWTGTDTSTANPRTDTGVTANVSVTANFAINTYTLTYNAGANGSISGNSSQTVAYGGSGTPVSAVPNPTYHFVNWSDASTANPRTDLNVNANITAQANFAINTYTLTYTPGPHGSISGNAAQTVAYAGNGTVVTAVPAANYHFVNWTPGGSAANPRTDLNVTANIAATANFAINTYTLTYTAGIGGVISGASPQSVGYGGSGTAVTAVPNPGYLFVHWSDLSTTNPRTDTGVTANINVTASFAPITIPMVTTDCVSSIAATTATGEGIVNGDGGSVIFERGIVWNTGGNPTTSGNKAAASGATGAYSASITGLTAGNIYHVRAYAINAIGTSYGNELTFTTLGPVSNAINTATGTGTATFITSNGTLTNLTAMSTPPCGSPTPPGLVFPHGFFSHSISGIPPGSTVILTISLPETTPVGTQYWKCMKGSWVNVTSLLGHNNGDNILTLTLTDGGPLDADGVANGTIVDPGGPAVPAVPVPGASQWGILILVVLLTGAIVRAIRKNQIRSEPR